MSVGDIFVEVKTEADSNDTTESRHDDELSAGMFHFFVRIFCDDLLLQSSTTNAWSNRSGGSLCTYACMYICHVVCMQGVPWSYNALR